MTLGAFIGWSLLGLSGLALIFFPEVRQKLTIISRGAINVFIEDKAKTPEGARAIFQQAIDVAQDRYAKANDLLRLRAGELEVARENLTLTKKELKELEESCETLVKNGRFDEANIIATQREEKLIDVERQTKLVETLTPIVAECKEISNHQELTLRRLKVQKKQILTDLEMNKQMTAMYDDLDALKKVSAMDKLLDSINEGHEDSRKQAIGAKVLHENRLETKTSRAQLEAKNIKNSDYIETLKKKHGKL